MTRGDKSANQQRIDEPSTAPALSTDGATLLAAVADVPVEVSLEIARFQLSVAELGALAVGEVLTTGRLLGETINLRAGSEIVATGELVDVDGELGIRVLRIGR